MTKFDFENGDELAVDKPGARPKTLWAAWFRLSGSIYTEPVLVSDDFYNSVDEDPYYFASNGDDFVKGEGWTTYTYDSSLNFASQNRDDVVFAIRALTEHAKLLKAYLAPDPEEYSE